MVERDQFGFPKEPMPENTKEEIKEKVSILCEIIILDDELKSLNRTLLNKRLRKKVENEIERLAEKRRKIADEEEKIR